MLTYPHTIVLTAEQREIFTRELRAFADDDIIRAAAVKTDTFCAGAAFYARTADVIDSTGELVVYDLGKHEDICAIFWAKEWTQPHTDTPAALRELADVLFEDAGTVTVA